MQSVVLSDLPGWGFRDASGRRWRSARVPGCVHGDLQRHGLIDDPHAGDNADRLHWIAERTWVYRLVFAVSDEFLKERRIDLVADGLDSLATVTLNGRFVGRSENMFLPARFAVRSALRAGRNELHVRFDSATRHIRTQRQSHRPRDIMDPVGGCTRIRKQQSQFGWDWGPRMVTAGIWRELRLEAWTGPRIASVRIDQHHDQDGAVALAVHATLSNAASVGSLRTEATLSLGGRVCGSLANGVIHVRQPQLWWPAGQGQQPLYDIEVLLIRDDTVVDRWQRRIGLRTIALRREPDRWGESFQFVINGRPIFAKGASWIPADTRVAELRPKDYEPLLRSAAAANMNMLRVWGGGTYEQDWFYERCDELGLLVWHDFMFACTLYPGDRAFLASVRREAEAQVRRLRHHACIALWCGNNEIELHNAAELRHPRVRAAYDRLFRKVLPESVAAHAPGTPYWRSTPARSERPRLQRPDQSGPVHFWQVWHGRRPVEACRDHVFRFVSEFGMQSLPSPETARRIVGDNEPNIADPTFAAHQKSPNGNVILLEYLLRRYRFPRDYAGLTYLTQIHQAHALQVAIEHWRRQQPRCAGALIWQLNDCWPAASWSTIEHGGRWKAAHFAARRFFAPTLATGSPSPGCDATVALHAIHDGPTDFRGRLVWQLLHLEGTVLRRGHSLVGLRPGECGLVCSVDVRREIARHGAAKLLLHHVLSSGAYVHSDDVYLFAPPAHLALASTPIRRSWRRADPGAWHLTLASTSYHHRVWLEVDSALDVGLSDNAFDLPPGRPRVITVTTDRPVRRATISRAIHVRSLRDSYA